MNNEPTKAPIQGAQFFHYAHGRFKRKDVLEDLTKIHAAIEGEDRAIYVNLAMYLAGLVLLYGEAKAVRQLILDHMVRPIGLGRTTEIRDLLENYLAILDRVPTHNSEGKEILRLGEPDPNLLELAT